MGRTSDGCGWLLLIVMLSGSAPAGRYTISNGTVYDTVARLTWQQAVPATSFTWSSDGTTGSAQDYCQSLTLGGFSTGWRLPTMKELASIVDVTTNNPAVDSNTFPSTPTSAFWTSSPCVIHAGLAWAVSFDDGSVVYFGASNALNVRCVRSSD
jgi:hypothetical protein